MLYIVTGCLWNPCRDILCILSKQQCSFFFNHAQDRGSFALPPLERSVLYIFRDGGWSCSMVYKISIYGVGWVFFIQESCWRNKKIMMTNSIPDPHHHFYVPFHNLTLGIMVPSDEDLSQGNVLDRITKLPTF